MAQLNLSRMDVASLANLRKQVNELLLKGRADIERQLGALAALTGERGRRGRGSSLKGVKVPPKYRDRAGNTWAGRGARPRWLVAAIKEGKKLEDFAIEKTDTGRKRRKK